MQILGLVMPSVITYIRRSILLTMSLYVNYFVTFYLYFADNYTYIVISDRDIASFQLIVWHVC